ncbi:MAG TPA: aminopeptidase N [Xanthomonadales bacterium]|nr:aminopeptidase N [Xanthomonadales bacterium]
MSTPAPARPVRLAEYRPPAWLVDSVELELDLDFVETRVRARLALRRNPDNPSPRLRLDGEGLLLDSAALDGRALDRAELAIDEAGMELDVAGDSAVLETVVRIAPEANTALEGLYRSGGFLLTQCEAEGFRHITYFPDRPDVLARYTVTLAGDRARFPVLLANGNPDGAGTLPHGRHWARWRDPFPKPCYLFAIVAGRLGLLEDRFRTTEGRDVALRLWADEAAIPRCAHAMDCIRRAMAWDEVAYGRSYDLDVFNVVATLDFNMGAMENKGLNIFNAKFIVADVDTATDDDFRHVEGVIGHEYFHNWTGNRVTCRDWFQLSLKEGLTVFRDQQFSAEMGSPAHKRIEDVRTLRAVQFAEDAGPFAHPVRPDSYLEINNFYTATVYEKGAEVVRMLHTLLGAEAFRRGTDLYFERHDGHAVTIEDFRAALADASGRDLSRFARWYVQAGTPQLRAETRWDAATQRYSLTLAQHTAPTPGQPDKLPVPIPVRLMLYAPDGTPLPLRLAGDPAGDAPVQRVVVLDDASRTFEFLDVPQAPVPSLLQGFSAPVQLVRDTTPDELKFLARHDRDAFNRWEAIQKLGEQAVLAGLRGADDGPRSEWFAALLPALAALLADPASEAGLVAECLVLPDEAYLAERVVQYDPQALHVARESLRVALGSELASALRATHAALATDDPLRRDGAAMARRRLRNCCLALLLRADPRAHAGIARAQFDGARNMTDRIAALTALVHNGVEGAQALAEAFHQRWRDDALVVDKWLTLQAANPQAGTLERVQRLVEHPAFSWRNPNKVRALIGAFARANRPGFHRVDGAGYRFVGEAVRTLDPVNPQVASRLAATFNAWRRLEPVRQNLMRTELERLSATPGLSNDVREIVARALA